MIRKWRLNKVESFGPLRVLFRTLYEDMRDEMSDSVSPAWGVAEYTPNNRSVEIQLGVHTVFYTTCSKDEGNAIYLKLWNMYRKGNGVREIEEWINEENARIWGKPA